jgi:hypothetical protein
MEFQPKHLAGFAVFKLVHETVHDPDAAQAVSGTSSEPDNGFETETPPCIFKAHGDPRAISRYGDFKAAFSKPVFGEPHLEVI